SDRDWSSDVCSSDLVGQSGWETVLENNRRAYTLDFVQRTRFLSSYSTAIAPTQFVDQLFAKARVTPSDADRNAAIAEFGGATNRSEERRVGKEGSDR